jgi:SAM-dependent methyltransferase
VLNKIKSLITKKPSSSLLVPPEKLIKHIGGHNAKDYVLIADHFFEIFHKYCGIKPTDKVLDVGCGCGRMAIPFTRFLTTGSYEGFDILPELIEWCQKNITPRYPTFHFQLADVHHNLYNKDAKLKGNDFRFPYADDYFDFTFLTSVFTHMLQDDVEQYMREIVRTLKPGGTSLLTFFIINEESERLMHTSAAKMKISYDYGGNGIRVADPKNPEAVIGYPESLVRRMLADNGFILQEPMYPGSWCGRQGSVTFQDFVVLNQKINNDAMQ